MVRSEVDGVEGGYYSKCMISESYIWQEYCKLRRTTCPLVLFLLIDRLSPGTFIDLELESVDSATLVQQ